MCVCVRVCVRMFMCANVSVCEHISLFVCLCGCVCEAWGGSPSQTECFLPSAPGTCDSKIPHKQDRQLGNLLSEQAFGTCTMNLSEGAVFDVGWEMPVHLCHEWR